MNKFFLTNLNIIFKLFGIKYEPLLSHNDVRMCYKDTYEECMQAFDNGVFNVEHDYFGRGEWPIILYERTSHHGHDEDWISYTISR